MHTPTFSIHICNFNHGQYLPSCLAGIARQSFEDYEVVITDDGSTDNSRDIIASAAAKDRRIKPKYFKQNQGLMAATKDVLGRVRGRYIFGEGADDFIINADFLALAAAAIESRPQAAGFYGVAGLLGAETNEVTGSMGSASREGYLSPQECYREILRGTMFVPGSSSIWKHDCIREIGGFDYSLGPQIDFLLNHALPARHGVVFTKTPMTVQRVYASATNFGAKAGTLWEATSRLEKVERRIKEWGLPYDGCEEDWRLWRARYTVHAIRTGGLNPAAF